jgi:hypothetical protein
MHEVQAPAGTVNLLVSRKSSTELSTPSTRNHVHVMEVQPDSAMWALYAGRVAGTTDCANSTAIQSPQHLCTSADVSVASHLPYTDTECIAQKLKSYMYQYQLHNQGQGVPVQGGSNDISLVVHCRPTVYGR